MSRVEVPVDVLAMAKSRGLSISRTEAMLLNSPNSKTLRVPNYLPDERVRYEVALWLGHLNLGHPPDWSWKQQLDALQYASNLLMPEEAFHQASKSLKSVKAIASHFGVPEHLVVGRLKTLIP